MTSTLVDRLNGVAEGLAVKAPVACATTGANIVLSGVQTIDGISVGNACERVLVKDQSDATTNGIYVASTGNWCRAVDFDGNRDAVTGTLVSVVGGTQNAGSLWSITAANPIVFGTSELTFAPSVLGRPLQRSIAGAGDLPVRTSDRILNINAAADLTPVLPLAVTRGGVPLTFKNLPGSHLQTLGRSGDDLFDGATTYPLVGGASVTLRPYADGVNEGYAIS